jgi:hypothetical protein
MSAAPLASPADARRFACDSLPLRLGFDFGSRVIATPLCRRLVRYDRTCMRLLYVFDNQGSRESRTKVAGAEIMPPLLRHCFPAPPASGALSAALPHCRHRQRVPRSAGARLSEVSMCPLPQRLGGKTVPRTRFGRNHPSGLSGLDSPAPAGCSDFLSNSDWHSPVTTRFCDRSAVREPSSLPGEDGRSVAGGPQLHSAKQLRVRSYDNGRRAHCNCADTHGQIKPPANQQTPRDRNGDEVISARPN